MNYIDYILLLIILLSIYNGWRKGFIFGLVDVTSWLGSFFLALYFFQNTAHLIQSFIKVPDIWLQPLAFILTLILSSWIINLLFYNILSKVPAHVHLNSINKLMGTVPGFITGLIYAALLAFLFHALPAFKKLDNDFKGSIIAGRLTKNASLIENRFSAFLKPLSEKLTKNLTISPKHTELVSLPFKVKDPKVRPDLEARMLQMVNLERRNVGLKNLKADPEFTLVARKHSTDMFRRGYFSHYTPEKKDPFDRIRLQKLSFLTAGENLALAANLAEAHRRLMNSRGHKANILHKAFGRVGIGIVDGGIYGIMVTQNFRN